MTPAPVLFDTREAAAALGVDPRTVLRWAKSGRIKPAKSSRAGYVFTGDEVARVAAIGRSRRGRRRRS